MYINKVKAQMAKAALKNEEFFKQDKELDSKGFNNHQKIKFFKNVRDREMAKG
jgi:hypothetical protein